MPETKTISSQTTTTIKGDDITILTKFVQAGNVLPNTLDAFISNEVSSQEGVSYEENQLLIQMKNYPTQIDYTIDDDGSLIVFSNQGDVNKYSIDSEGNLIYTE